MNVRKLCVNVICDELFIYQCYEQCVVYSTVEYSPDCVHTCTEIRGREQREYQPFLPGCQLGCESVQPVCL